nr:hypothetical protein HUO10_006649 [Paraburkholderia busanensis]
MGVGAGSEQGDGSATFDAVGATLDAWRRQGADRHDPVRFHFIDALARRARVHGGATRRVLDAKLATLVDAYAVSLAKAEAEAEAKTETASSTTPSATGEPTPSALTALTTLLASHFPAEGEHRVTAHGLPTATSYPELPALDHFRDIWSKVRTEKQLRQSFEQVPGNAGPLNSNSLVHRALSLMRELSPGYLKQFMTYVDALSWMEQMNATPAPTTVSRNRTHRK